MQLLNYNELTLPIVLLFILALIGAKHMIDSYNKKLEIVSLGKNFEYHGTWYNLSEYFTDKNGVLYSRNADTWEVDRKNHKDILICSDNSKDKSGNIYNSLRSTKGKKVTIKRSDINYKKLVHRGKKVVKLSVKPIGSRHLKITKVVA